MCENDLWATGFGHFREKLCWNGTMQLIIDNLIVFAKNCCKVLGLHPSKWFFASRWQSPFLNFFNNIIIISFSFFSLVSLHGIKRRFSLLRDHFITQRTPRWPHQAGLGKEDRERPTQGPPCVCMDQVVEEVVMQPLPIMPHVTQSTSL